MNTLKSIASLVVIAIISGCATPSLYSWGKYESDMYRYYKNPEHIDELMLGLAMTLEEAESKQKVPPGLYAEYGYLLLETGDSQQAVVYFEKEKALWPESSVLMDAMLATARADLASDR